MNLLPLILAGLLLVVNSAGAQEAASRATFPIGGFSSDPAQVKADGFTLVGPVYSKNRAKLAQAEAAGLPFIYSVGVKIDFHGKNGETVTELDLDAIRREVRTQVEEVAASEAIYAWYLKPEELRHWMPLEMEYLRTVSETIREADPKKRPVWMYEPNHRGRTGLEKMLPYQQISGKGLYVNYSNRKTERAWLSWSLEQQQQAIADVNPETLPVAVLEMFQDPEEAEKPLIASWVRHDSYSALLGGARAIVIYSFAKRRNFQSHDLYYQAYAEVARELNGESALGSVFLLGKEIDPPVVELVDGPTTTRITARSAKIFPEAVDMPALVTKAYRWNQRKYLFLMNSSPEPMTVRLKEGADWQPLPSVPNPRFSPAHALELAPWDVAIFSEIQQSLAKSSQ